MIQAVALILLCFADRFRGHPGIAPKQIKRAIEALLVTLGAGISDPLAIAATTTLVWGGICLGSYGNAVGPALQGIPPARAKTINNPGPEWWQWGPLLRNTWVSLIAVGLIWGLPVLLVWKLDHRVAAIPVAFVIAFPFSTWIARHIWAFYPSKTADWAWAVQQWAFGPIAAVSLAITSMGINK